ncbi:MAG: T9SS type A sorting domain-containing protein [Saprospiraceae bacterium]|nr:T9SS type A sorting domain-containing protein [Saprospiraceae bacterium]
MERQMDCIRFFRNPAQNELTVRYSLDKKQEIILEVFGLDGKLVSEILNETKPAGHHELQVDIKNLAYGVYMMTLTTQTGSYTLPFVVEK